jgi:3'-phosphoadenosine 5'-phosphosulfate sulfotransferase (PAPS reductase)/FAD synthetase
MTCTDLPVLDLANLPVGHFYPKPDLHSYHWVLINSSAGKDSQAMLDHLVKLCDAQGYPRNQIVVVHCDLGRAEWEGTAELAQEQAEHYGLRFVIVKRDGTVYQGKVLGDLPAQVLERHQANIRNGKDVSVLSPWPNRDNRWCTSDQKTAQVSKLITALCDEARAATGTKQIRVLNCLGLRAEESRERAEKT